jgi:hypothetical protein
MRGNNLRDLIKEELVNRFEDVVKNEINEFRKSQDAISSRFTKIESDIELFRKEIKGIRDYISFKCDELYLKYEQNKNSIEKSFDEQRKFIRINSDAITAHIKENSRLLESFADQSKVEKSFESVKAEIKNIQNGLHRAKEEAKNEDFALKTVLQEYSDVKSNFLKDELSDLANNFSDVKSKISCFSVDNEGFLRELRCCKKEAFVQEKKIENIYSLIERLKAGMQ